VLISCIEVIKNSFSELPAVGTAYPGSAHLVPHSANRRAAALLRIPRYYHGPRAKQFVSDPKWVQLARQDCFQPLLNKLINAVVAPQSAPYPFFHNFNYTLPESGPSAHFN
jgi:hypothetical protein